MYMAGTMYSVMIVETSMPPTTAIPIVIRPLAPSPVAKASGSSPRMVEALVIRIGRRRCSAASSMACILAILM